MGAALQAQFSSFLCGDHFRHICGRSSPNSCSELSANPEGRIRFRIDDLLGSRLLLRSGVRYLARLGEVSPATETTPH
jgi:hypothetical protein